MQKVFTLAPNEDWIVDRFVKEWTTDNGDIAVDSPKAADVIWLMANWAWTQVGLGYLATKKVLTTVHHEVPEKFGHKQRQDFLLRDRYTLAYHVPNKHTADFVKSLTQKPIHIIPYWSNQRIWHPTRPKDELRKEYTLPENGFLVGSFQRDTEGHDLKSPKLEKGPDLLADNLEKLFKVEPRLHVVLAGWRRQYLMTRLQAARIPYSYYELPPQHNVNELYQTLDMYMVSSRYEGGPQSLIECGLLGVPCISRDIGMAQQVLPHKAINNDLWQARPAIPDVESLKLPSGYQPYRQLLESL